MISADEARFEGLRAAAVIVSGKRACAHEVTGLAGELARWLMLRPAFLRLSAAPFTFPQGMPGPGVPTRINPTGGHMSVTMTDDQKVTYAVEPEDDKGNPTSDTLTWAEDSGGVTVTIAPAADGLSAVVSAVAPGTATISVTDGTLSASDLVTITPGAVASLVLTPGAPEAE